MSYLEIYRQGLARIRRESGSQNKGEEGEKASTPAHPRDAGEQANYPVLILSPSDRESLRQVLITFDGDVIAVLGPKTFGSYTSCRGCGAGTWVTFGPTPLCQGCARQRGLRWA